MDFMQENALQIIAYFLGILGFLLLMLEIFNKQQLIESRIDRFRENASKEFSRTVRRIILNSWPAFLAFSLIGLTSAYNLDENTFNEFIFLGFVLAVPVLLISYYILYSLFIIILFRVDRFPNGSFGFLGFSLSACSLFIDWPFY